MWCSVKIIQVENLPGFYVDTDEDDWYQYIRYSADNWLVRMGESYEPLYDCEKLEILFKEITLDKKPNYIY